MCQSAYLVYFGPFLYPYLYGEDGIYAVSYPVLPASVDWVGRREE